MIAGELRTADTKNTTRHIGAAQMRALHTHDVSRLVLTRFSVVTLCSVPLVCCLPSSTHLGCVIVNGQEADGIYSIESTSKKWHHALKLGGSSHPLTAKGNTLSSDGLPRAPEGTNRARTTSNVSGRASRVHHMEFLQKGLERNGKTHVKL